MVSAGNISKETGTSAGRQENGPESGNRRRVLVITYYWPPSGGAGVQRFLKFVKYFRDHGVDPVVLTCSNPTYPIVDISLLEDVPGDVTVARARTLEPFGIYSRISGVPADEAANPTTVLGGRDLGSAQRLARWLRANLFLPDARVGWVPFALRKARRLIRDHRIDTVITTGPPHSTHFIGRTLQRQTGIRWIADFRDPWTDIHYNRVLPRTDLARKIDLRMEASVLTFADEVTVTAPGTARYFARRVDRRYHTITNGFDPNDFAGAPETSDRDLSDKSGQADPAGTSSRSHQPEDAPSLLIRHVGSITETSVPESLLRVLSRFPANHIRLECIGATHSAVTKLAGELGLGPRLTIRPYVPHRVATALMQQSDLNLVVVHRSDDSRILIPGKLYDYLKAGKPVLVIGPPEGDAAAIVKHCRMGASFDYDDEQGLESFIRSLPATFSPDEQAIASFSRSELTRRMAALVCNTQKQSDGHPS